MSARCGASTGCPRELPGLRSTSPSSSTSRPQRWITARSRRLPAWDSLSDDAKTVYARQMEVYATLVESANQVGRLVDAIENLGELDDTLFIYISGDKVARRSATSMAFSSSGVR